jgi:hypothetical protein
MGWTWHESQWRTLYWSYQICSRCSWSSITSFAKLPTTLLVKIQVEEEWLKCGVCVCCGEHPSPSFIVDSWRFGSGKYGNLSEPPPHTAIQPPEEIGPRPHRLGCDYILDSLPSHRPWPVAWGTREFFRGLVYLCILPLQDLCFNIFIFSIYFYAFHVYG